MWINYTIYFCSLSAINVILWIYVIAFSGIYPVSGWGVVVCAIISCIIHFGIIQILIPLTTAVLKVLAISNQNP
jgi:hypothetical protein